jgi:hypothetical protein
MAGWFLKQHKKKQAGAALYRPVFVCRKHKKIGTFFAEDADCLLKLVELTGLEPVTPTMSR